MPTAGHAAFDVLFKLFMLTVTFGVMFAFLVLPILLIEFGPNVIKDSNGHRTSHENPDVITIELSAKS